jgi:pimeloyl-ACP methyl ester carboxylesterase
LAEAQDLGAMCGTLKVPLDRKDPRRERIKIYFELYLHTNPGPAESALIGNPGGPGLGTTQLRAPALILFAQNLDVHDLLLIDDRGRGLSSTIDCEELQHGTAPFALAEADCAAQLGDADSRYGTGDVAMDIDAVRAALGYDKVDFLGQSYGGMDATAYATRFGQHLRSIVLDAPGGTPLLRAFLRDSESARATRREVRLVCLHSPTCSADHPNPGNDWEELIQAIRAKPVRGRAYDGNGNLVEVRVDEAALLYMASWNVTGNFVNVGELLAAGEALAQDDPTPLLRLGAEITPLVTDYGDPTVFSQGAHSATYCVDAYQPWDWSAPISERKRQFAEAVEGLPFDYFAPFSKAAGTSLQVSLNTQCLWWEKPTPPSPVTPPHPIYPNVPTLVLGGDLDTIVPLEEVRRVAAQFPRSTFVPVAGAGHVTIFSQCSANLQAQFFESLQVGDTTCTTTPETVWPALGRFPLRAADARPAEIDPDANNQICKEERKVVTVAVQTALDTLKRASIGGGTGAGLRAGTFESSFDDNGNQLTTLVNCAFAKDVTVNGTVLWGADFSLSADLWVSGPGTAGGTLHIEGVWQAPGPVGNFKVSGTLGGRHAGVLVPEA